MLADADRSTRQHDSVGDWHPMIDVPINDLVMLDNSGHRPLFERPNQFVGDMVNTVLADGLPMNPAPDAPVNVAARRPTDRSGPTFDNSSTAHSASEGTRARSTVMGNPLDSIVGLPLGTICVTVILTVVSLAIGLMPVALLGIPTTPESVRS